MDTSLQNKILAGFNGTISILGTPMVWNRATKNSLDDFLQSGACYPLGAWADAEEIPHVAEIATQNVVAGFKTVGKDDMDIINSYGIETRVITLSKSTIKFEPVKFDTFTVHNLDYVVQAAHQIFVNGILAGYKCYARGA